MASISQHVRLVWHGAVAIAVRVLLVLLGAGEALIWQPEVTTPTNTILTTREGLGLLRLRVSPYSGDSCHVPPLWLAVTAPVALHPVLCAVPNIVADIVAAAALYAAACALYHRTPSQKSSNRGECQLGSAIPGEPTCPWCLCEHAASSKRVCVVHDVQDEEAYA